MVTVVALVPITVLATSSIVLASNQVTIVVNKQVQTTAAVSSVVIGQRTDSLSPGAARTSSGTHRATDTTGAPVTTATGDRGNSPARRICAMGRRGAREGRRSGTLVARLRRR